MSGSGTARASQEPAGARRSPVASEVGVVALVPDRWSEQWQPRHQVMSRLGRYFSVVWVNPAPEWRDAWMHPARHRVRDADPQPGLHVHSPDVSSPRFYRPDWLSRATTRLRLRGARRHLVRRGCSKIVLYVWRPEFADALDMLAHDFSCYHIDDEYTFAKSDQPIPAEERRLLEEADQVIIHSPALLEKKGKINPNTHFVPNGVDFDAHAAPAPEPADLAGIPRPRIGYTGWLKNQLDWGLLEGLVGRHPEWSFVFVGAIRHPALGERVESLDRHPNVHMLGGKSSEVLARYPQHFDVCLMPYNDDDYTRYIYPLKLHEYLATGTPTVGTPIRSLQEFAPVVELARGVDEWSAAIERALQDRGAGRRRERQAVAREHDWGILVHRIAMQMADGLDPAIAEAVGSARPETSR